MAEASTYPQIPKSAYWALRRFLNKRPNVTLAGDLVAAEISVQPTAAKQYVIELQRLGILDGEAKLTKLGHEWRLDDTYRTATNSIIEACYPESLFALAHPGEAEKAKVMGWFAAQGLGTGSAGNKAATYLLLANDNSMGEGDASTSKKGSTSSGREGAAKRAARIAKQVPELGRAVAEQQGTFGEQQNNQASIPLNINLQIHISADASPEQINLVFESMKRHLYGS
jgi:hypothetical protein